LCAQPLAREALRENVYERSHASALQELLGRLVHDRAYVFALVHLFELGRELIGDGGEPYFDDLVEAREVLEAHSVLIV
jgi:hypothetical protein